MTKSIYKFAVLSFLFLLSIPSNAQITELKYLSGTGNDDTVEWEFFCSAGMNSGTWTTIPVPSCWELQGFGTYNYGIDPWEDRLNEYGMYRYEFVLPESWKGKKVNIVFEAVMTDAEVMINGQLAGPIHQGAFYEFKYDITRHLNFGNTTNLLEVTVHKHSADNSVNEAERWGDYWVLGGIYRPVYLEALPADHIAHVATDARANGDFRADVYFNSSRAASLVVELHSMEGLKMAETEEDILNPREGKVHVKNRFEGIKSWNPEAPNLYYFEFKLLDRNRRLLHQTRLRTGFRTIEVREKDGIYVNGTKIKFKGINRHSFWPSSGRTTNKAISIKDVELIKEMNMNAVRMSHYPPDKHFLEVCDSLGLFVINELAGWGPPPYDTEIGKILVKEMVMRDVNHPSIIFWANGNEGGWNPDLDDEFLNWDIQQREVIRPRQIFRKINTLHYFDYNYLAYDSYMQDRIFFSTEFLHGAWDEGHGAGLEDRWRIMWNDPINAGGFLWNFSDEAMVRTDRNNILDANGRFAPDGITGPHREKEGSFFTVKEIWAPVYFEKKFITPLFDGTFVIENRYHYTNLNQCKFEAQWVRFRDPDDNQTTPLVIDITAVPTIDLDPGVKGALSVELPENWMSYDALYIKGIDPYENEIFTWSFPLKGPDEYPYELPGSRETAAVVSWHETGTSFVAQSQGINFEFEKKTGKLSRASTGQNNIALHNGPRFITEREIELSDVHHHTDEDGQFVLEFFFQGEITKFRNIQYRIKWTVKVNGLLDLDVSGHYMQGITFDYPEEKIQSIKRLSDGPFRVWRNRMKGTKLAVWKNDYNNTITGDPASNYDYPEFKGFYSSLYWARLFNHDNSNMTIYNHTPYTFFRVFTPDIHEDTREGFGMDDIDYPEGDISFLNAIPPVGTMFRNTDIMGPQSQRVTAYGWDAEPVRMKITFDFLTK